MVRGKRKRRRILDWIFEWCLTSSSSRAVLSIINRAIYTHRRHDIDEGSRRNERRAEIGDEGVHAPGVDKARGIVQRRARVEKLRRDAGQSERILTRGRVGGKNQEKSAGIDGNERFAANLKLKSQDLFDNSLLRNEEDIETAKRRASRVLEIAESLSGVRAFVDVTNGVGCSGGAAANLKHLIATSENRQELAEAAKDLGKEVWEKLGNRANENSNVSSMKMTVDRLSGRVRELLRKLQEDKRKREEEAAMAAVMGLDGLSSPRGGMGSDGGSLMNSPRTPGVG